MPRMRAKDSFYSSETKQVDAGEEFEIESNERARDFVKRGLAEFLVGSAKTENAPLNKAEPPPTNKAESSPANKAEPGPGEAPISKSRKGGTK